MPPTKTLILVVDDDAVTRHILFGYLSRAGYQTITASTGDEALEQLRVTQPALVLLDLLLPGMDGYDVLRRIRANDATVDLPVVVLTALEADEEIERAFEAGADDFLHKPFRSSELVARIRGQLRLRGYLLELAQKERDAQVLSELTRALASSLEIREILFTVVRRIAETVDVDRCSIIVAPEGSERGYVVATNDDAAVQNLPIELEKYPEIQRVLQTQEPLTIEDAQTHPLLGTARNSMTGSPFHSLTLLPIAFESRAMGVLFLRSVEGRGRFAERELSFCQIAANATAVALRNARLMQELREETQALDTRAVVAETRAKSLERYADLFRSAADGILVLDPSMSAVFVNPRGAEILGFPSDRIIGRKVTSALSPHEAERASASVQQAMAGVPVSLDVEFRRGDKALRIVSISISQLEQGAEGASVVTFRDVTDDRQTALELSRTRDFLGALVEGSPDAIVAADPRGKILIWNRAAERICGMSRDDVVGKRNIGSIYPAGVARDIMRALRAGEQGASRVENFRTELITDAGEHIPIHLSASILREGNEEAGTVGIFSDLRDRLRMEERLAHAQQALAVSEKQSLVAKLAGTAAHELNQPLTSIMGYAELMLRRVEAETPAHKAASVIMHEAERMAEIVRKIGTMTRLETKEYYGNTQIFDLDRAHASPTPTRGPTDPPEGDGES